MNDERNEILFSQLADGELESDRLNEVLLDALDDEQSRTKLKEMLRQRQATSPWRGVQPPRPIVIVAKQAAPMPRRRLPWRVASMAVAACLGGVLVLTGFWAAGRLGNSGPAEPRYGPGIETVSSPAVTTEQMQQVAEVFALHESIAGPLAWYAADDQNIKLASARGAEASNQPVAVLLRLTPTSPARPHARMSSCAERESPRQLSCPSILRRLYRSRSTSRPRARTGRSR